MSVENVKQYFKDMKLDSRIKEFDVSSATVDLAAQAIGCTPDRIAKSISFKVEDKPVLIVTSGDVKIDNSKFKTMFHVKAKMLTPDEVENLIGHKIGGVCPFGIKDSVKVYLDTSLKRFDTVYPACGSSNSVIELSIDELEKYSNYIQWIDVCKTI